MTPLPHLTWLIILLTVVGGYRFATRFYHDDPLFGLLFGLVVGISAVAALPIIIYGFGILVVLLPVIYLALQYIQQDTTLFAWPDGVSLERFQSRLADVSTAARSRVQRLSTRIRNHESTFDQSRGTEARERQDNRGGADGPIVPCVRCDTPVRMSNPVTECPDCGFALTIVGDDYQ
jgi:hypothetical protein